MKHFNIPIFVSHLGCPNKCVFCNQHKINGVDTDLDENDILYIIDENLSTIKNIKNRHVELAFFGGSFTGIDQEKQIEFLEIVQPYIRNGEIDSIRLSTRPDYINDDILKYLEGYNVKMIELGVQSFDEKVLEKSKRNHSVEDVYKAVKLIKDSKIELGIQIMPGLPGSNVESDIFGAEIIAKIKPENVRIYPTLVIQNSELENMYYEKKYTPLTIEETIDILSKMIAIIKLEKIKIVRVGLQPSEELRSEGNIIAGPFHPAIRELAEGEIFYKFLKKIKVKDDRLLIESNERDISKIIGNKKRNKTRLEANLDIKINDKLLKDNFIVNRKRYTIEDIYKNIVYECGEINETDSY